MEDSAPDSITVCRFRNILVETDLYDRVLDEISRPLENRGVVVKRRAIVDVSITDTFRRPHRRKEYEAVTDREEDDGKDGATASKYKSLIFRYAFQPLTLNSHGEISKISLIIR